MSGRSSREISSATPSTWPATMWPPSSSPTFIARSRLSRVPVFQSPAVVIRSVSAAASTETAVRLPSLPVSTTVRQTPECEIDAPMAMESTG